MKVVTQTLIGSTEEWERINPVLLNGMIGVEIRSNGTRRVKFGDGKSNWKSSDLKALRVEDVEGLEELLSGRLNNEAQARQSADTALQTNIDEEKSERQEAVSAEAQARQSADTALQTNIDREKSERQAAVSAEETARKEADTTLQNNITAEAQARQQADTTFQNNIDNINNTLNGVKTLTVKGALLTRVINGFTNVAKSLFGSSVTFTTDKTLISDGNGTIGVYKEDIGSATLNVKTIAISPISSNEPTLLGTVAHFANLPLTITAATNNGWNTPRLDDYATVLNDETNDNQRVEWYVADIDSSGNITWGNPVIINTGDYQSQTTAADTGKVLIGGAAAGTFGQSIPIDTVPKANSNNLITSNAVNQADQVLQNNINNIYSMRFTYVIDSNQKLADWANNVNGNNYSRVLIKAGTWTLNTNKTGGTTSNLLAVIDMNITGTKCVVGESGSSIVINNTQTADTYLVGIIGLLTGSYPDYSVLSTDYFMHNVNITLNMTGNGNGYVYGFNNCTNLTNCTSAGTGYYGSGFYKCTNLTNCTSAGTGYGYGFNNCTNLTNCTGNATTTTTGCGFNKCTNLINCTGTGTSLYNTNIGYGFYKCTNLINCTGTGDNAINNGKGYGFSQCRTGFGNKRSSTASKTSTFYNCLMAQDRTETAPTSNDWDNTAAGGWNNPN